MLQGVLDSLLSTTTRLLPLYCLALLTACTPLNPDDRFAKADEALVAQDRDFSLVKLHSGLTYEEIAEVYLGSAAQAWQIREINAPSRGRDGQIVAVPRRPLNPTSVYTTGYRTLPILVYQRFADRPQAGAAEIAAEAFEAQLRYLIDNGFAILTLAQVDAILNGTQPIPEKAVAITIDEAHRSVYDIAWPTLRKYGVPVTLFLGTDFTSASEAMSWDQVMDMQASPLVTIGLHVTPKHDRATPAEDSNGQSLAGPGAADIRQALDALEDRFETAPQFLSYAPGNVRLLDPAVAAEEGIVLALTANEGENATFADPYRLHRMQVRHQHSLQDFKTMLRVFRPGGTL